MFRSRVFGGTPDAFHLACEYGPASVPGSGNMPTPEALASMQLDWTSAESEIQVLERFAQLQSAVMLEQADERVSLQLSWEAMAHAESFPNQHLNAKIVVTSRPPVLRSLHFSRTSGSGSASESLMTTLLQHMDLSTVWKLRVSEGFPPHFWASCCEVHQWMSLFNLNLSSSGLVSLPGVIGELVSLHVLRLNHNKLTSLPQELGYLVNLEVLSVNHNQLTTLPAELRRCTALRELHLEHNRLVTPLLDLTHATALESLQLYGNPLEYLPELAPAVSLRSLSLANVRILADVAYSRWEVEVTAPSSSYTSMVIGGRVHKLQPVFNLVFRRSSVQHPLLAGAMSRLMEDPSNLELLVREDVALQQLVLASMGSGPLVVQQAVKIMSAVGAYAGAAKRLVKHNVVRAITGMLASGDKSLQLSGLRVLSSLAAGAAEGELPGEVLVPTALLDRLLALIRAPDTHQEVRCAALHALGNSAFDVSNRRRYLQSPGLMQLLVMLAAAPDTEAPPAPSPSQAPTTSSQQPAPAAPPTWSVAQQQEAEAEDVGIEGSAQLARSSPDQLADPPASNREAASTDPVVGLQSGSRLEPPPAAARVSNSPPRPPSPHSSPPSAAAAAGAGAGHLAGDEVAAAASPPTVMMSRVPSATGTSAATDGPSSTAAPADDAEGDAGSGKHAIALATAASAMAAAIPTGGDAGSTPPRKLLAAAAGAAAAAAAHTTSSPSATGAAPAAPVPGNAKKVAGGGGAAAAAAAEAFLPKQRMVDVNDPVKLQAIRLLGILGQNEQVRIALGQPPIRGRGLRVLAMDGGGMKGMAMVELLRQLERRAGAPIWTLFDVIGGTSTGGLLAVSLGILRLKLDACQEIYTSLGNKVFNQSTAVQEDATWRDNLYRMYTTSSANMRVAVYGSKHDAANYEDLLRRFCAVKELGCASDRLIDTAVMGGPKVFVVATLASSRPAAPFAFRNYELPDEATPVAQQLAACAGSCKHHVWEAVRASSAAPYYLDDFLTADGKRFQDGATTANNPTIIALQQARLLHPQLPVDCVVSLGCGSEPSMERSKGLSTVIDTGAVLLESACSTDRVHEALATTLQLVPGCRYFRFNAVDTRCNMDLDDIRPESWTRLLSATTEYCSQPDVAAQFDRLAAMLQQGSPAAAGALAGEDVPIGGSRAAKAQPHVVGRHTGARLSKSGHAQQQQQHHLQQQTGQLLLASLSLRDLPDSSTDRPPSRHVSGDMHAAVQQALQQAAADTGPSSAPRLLYQHGLLLVQARRHVAGVAAAAAVARGADLTALQQQECVAELLAAALPADLVHTCDLSVASAAAAQGLAALAQEQHGTDAANHNHHHHHHHQQQHEQHPPLRSPSDVAIAAAAAEAAAAASKGVHSAGPGSLETSPRRMDSRHGNTTNSSSNNQHMQNGLAAAAAVNSSTLTRQEVAERRKAALLQRASDTGVGGSSMSPKSSSWLEYLFPWQQGGAASAGSSPRQQQQPPFLLDGSKAGRQQLGADSDAAALAGAPTAAAGGALGSGGAAGAGANVPDAGDSRSPGRLAAANGQGPPRRMMGDGTRPQGSGMQAVQSSPSLVSGGSSSMSGQRQQQQQQNQEDGSPAGSLLKIKSLPAQYHSPQQQQQQQGAAAMMRSTQAGQQVPEQQQQQQHQQQSQTVCGSAAVSAALRQHLLSAAGRVGVVHLALTATQAGLVAGWQQQLTAVVEPGPEAAQLLEFLAQGDDSSTNSSSSSSSLSQLLTAEGPVLPGPQGALVAVLAQQQVLAPVPTDNAAALAAQQSVTQFVTSWLLQLTVPDASRILGVSEVWPLLSQLQQLIVVSSSCLPKAMVHVLLRGGVSAVVCGTEPAEVASLSAADIAEFFRVFYAEGLWQGLDVVEALQAATAAVPTVGDSAYECYQLM